MNKTRKAGISVLVMFLVGCIVFASFAIYTDKVTTKKQQDSTQNTLSETLLGVLGVEFDNPDSADVLSGKRLSQQITVTTEDGVISAGGTVTKIQDDFYPGSYKITFAKKAILSSRAVIEVQMDVKKGDEIYVLIGDKDKGYTEYACVTAQEDNIVSFDTNILQDYTLSTTDIKSAQEAMADIFSSDGESN